MKLKFDKHTMIKILRYLGYIHSDYGDLANISLDDFDAGKIHSILDRIAHHQDQLNYHQAEITTYRTMINEIILPKVPNE